MLNPIKYLQASLTGIALLVGVSLHAGPVTVTELGVGAYETVWISSSTLGSPLHVYASVIKLDVDGTKLDGFCIDPWHWSAGGALPYELESLALAPKSANDTTPNPMGASTALQIQQLWQQYYSPSIDNVNAAALQIEIWQLVDAAVNNGTFSLLSVDGGDSAAVYAALSEMTAFLANNPNAPAADLVAVTGRGGQDYVIPNSVPEGGATVAMLGGAFLGLAALRRRYLS